MGDHFKPWRRKIAVVTLTMACVFVAGWARSLVVQDSVTLGEGTWLVSSQGAIGWSYFWIHDTSPQETATKTRSDDTNEIQLEILDNIDRIVLGNPNLKIESGEFKASYWWFAVPLTLLSAWLLLSKPRTKPSQTPKPVAEPGPEVAT